MEKFLASEPTTNGDLDEFIASLDHDAAALKEVALSYTKEAEEMKWLDELEKGVLKAIERQDRDAAEKLLLAHQQLINSQCSGEEKESALKTLDGIRLRLEKFFGSPFPR